MWNWALAAATVSLGGIVGSAQPARLEKGACTLIGCSDYVQLPFAEAEPSEHDIEIEFGARHVTCHLTATTERAGSTCTPSSRDPLARAVRSTERGFQILLYEVSPRALRVTIHSKGDASRVVDVTPEYEFHYPNGRSCGSPCRHGHGQVITLGPSPAKR